MANLGYIQVTRECNQMCRFCSNPPTELQERRFSDMKRMVDRFVKDSYAGVILTGGEPTLGKDLHAIIEYCRKIDFPCRLTTNGQKLADKKYVDKLAESGLKHLHLSIYSCKPEIQNYLTQNPDSFRNISLALTNLAQQNTIIVNINTVINRYNADHLVSIVRWVMEQNPNIPHFVWNNLDPLMNRASRNKNTIPRLYDFEVELQKAMEYLSAQRKTFRVERVPLCYMGLFPHCSTETRKIVKKEERMVYFLDEKACVRQHQKKQWVYDKAPICHFCSVNDICAGLYQMDTYYSSHELYPLFIDKQEVVRAILNDSDYS